MRRLASTFPLPVPVFFAVALLPGSIGLAGNKPSATTDPLLKTVEKAIDVTRRRFLTADHHTPWQILHGMLAFRGEYEVKDKTTGKRMNAAEWMAKGVYYRNEPWFEKTKHGARAHPYTTDYIFEGHPNQFLAIMSLAGFPIDFQFKAGKDTVTVRDIINHSKWETNDEEETTWTLWAFSHYLGVDATWKNKRGEMWNIERLVSIQNKQRLDRAACGGSHSLFALAYALKQYRKTGRPLRGVWLSADMRVKRHIAIARAFQNHDGSFSSENFERRGFSVIFKKRLSSSGHTLEFLMMSLPDNRLNERWVRLGVESVAKELIDNQRLPAEPGALYHALDGLMLYRARITGKVARPAGVTAKVAAAVRAKRPISRNAKIGKLPLPLPPKP